MSKVLIIGAGGVGQVVTHKCAQRRDIFSEITLASRTKSKCDTIAAQLGGDGVALGLGAGCQGDLAEDVAALGAFVGDNLADAAGADDKDFAHSMVPSWMLMGVIQGDT